MTTKIASLSLSLLLAGALTVLAQSPTTSAPTGQGATQDPYGATMDHPNPGSVAAPSSATSNTTSNTPATDSTQNNNAASTSTTPSSTDTSTTTTTTTSGTTDSSNNTAATSTDATTPSSMPKTGSELPLLFAIGCLALAGACGVRAARNRV